MKLDASKKGRDSQKTPRKQMKTDQVYTNEILSGAKTMYSQGKVRSLEAVDTALLLLL